MNEERAVQIATMMDYYIAGENPSEIVVPVLGFLSKSLEK